MGLLAEATVDAADDPEAVRQFAGKLQSEAIRLGALVNELIALSRLQGAEPLPDLAVVEVDAVVAGDDRPGGHRRPRTPGSRVTSDEPSGLLVRGDRSLLVTALTNLVDNAINYSPAGTQVSVSRTLRDGHGADRRHRPRRRHRPGVHQSGSSSGSSGSTRPGPGSTGGTGLGLAIVKHVAANHGGTATVWSRPGTGSTFTLRTAARRAERSADAEPAPATIVGPSAGRPVPAPDQPRHRGAP